jgi:hypothetical protein
VNARLLDDDDDDEEEEEEKLLADTCTAALTASASACLSPGRVEGWCDAVGSTCRSLRRALLPLLLLLKLLLMLPIVCGCITWKTLDGGGALVFDCMVFEEEGRGLCCRGRGGGSMLRDAWFGRPCMHDGAGGNAGERMSVGEGSSNSNPSLAHWYSAAMMAMLGMLDAVSEAMGQPRLLNWTLSLPSSSAHSKRTYTLLQLVCCAMSARSPCSCAALHARLRQGTICR